MKNYNKILEAINRGIKFALDDFDDNELQGQVSSKVNNKDLGFEGLLFNEIINIPLLTTINIDLETKRLIRQKYKQLLNYCLSHNIKCVVKEHDDLLKFIRRVTIVDKKANLNWLDVSHITDMRYMFDDYNAKGFRGDISEWDVSNVTTMENMFYGCNNFNCDISNWDVSNVKNMKSMFVTCTKFDQPIQKWNVSNVENMCDMFAGCTHFNQDISNWDVSNVKDTSWMFSRCYKFNQPIGKWDVSNVKYMDSMLFKCTSFAQDLSGWDVSNVQTYISFAPKTKITPEQMPKFGLPQSTKNVIKKLNKMGII